MAAHRMPQQTNENRITRRLTMNPNRTARFGLTIAGLALALMSTGALIANAADWPGKAEWDKVVAAAKKEGKLVVAGPSGRAWRGVLVKFQNDYPEIKISVTPFAGRDFWPKVLKEREVGKNLWDIRVGGATTAAWRLSSQGGIAPVRPMLMLPEVTDEKNWYGGFDHMYTDKGKKFFPTFCIYESAFAYFNKDFVKQDTFSVSEMLDPKWKGKISMAEPSEGSATVTMAMLMKDPRYGKKFIKTLLQDQKPIITKNPRQLMGWFVSGKYPISIGIPSSSIRRFQKRGVKLNMGEVSGMKRWSPGVCGAQVLEPRPHPNATIVFVNWLFSRKTQEMIMPVVGLNSRMKGVPIANKARLVDYSKLDEYKSGQTEEYRAYQREAKEFVKGLAR
jgi:ABC-type Fe3+ transport system substrate-binding protein